jgi:opacity protein-like surface antigen
MAVAATALAQENGAVPRHEIGLTLGGLLSQTRESATARLDLGSGIALQANYGYRLTGGSRAALFGEVHFLANPLRDVASGNKSITRDVATIFVTPGLRLKFNGAGRISPYGAIGGGWAVFEQSTNQLNGAPNPASRLVNHGAFDYGAGVDLRFWRFVGLRGEVRDFYTGSPNYNTRLISCGEHNVVAGGGLVLKFGS